MRCLSDPAFLPGQACWVTAPPLARRQLLADAFCSCCAKTAVSGSCQSTVTAASTIRTRPSRMARPPKKPLARAISDWAGRYSAPVSAADNRPRRSGTVRRKGDQARLIPVEAAPCALRRREGARLGRRRVFAVVVEVSASRSRCRRRGRRRPDSVVTVEAECSSWRRRGRDHGGVVVVGGASSPPSGGLRRWVCSLAPSAIPVLVPLLAGLPPAAPPNRRRPPRSRQDEGDDSEDRACPLTG